MLSTGTAFGAVPVIFFAVLSLRGLNISIEYHPSRKSSKYNKARYESFPRLGARNNIPHLIYGCSRCLIINRLRPTAGRSSAVYTAHGARTEASANQEFSQAHPANRYRQSPHSPPSRLSPQQAYRYNHRLSKFNINNRFST